MEEVLVERTDLIHFRRPIVLLGDLLYMDVTVNGMLGMSGMLGGYMYLCTRVLRNVNFDLRSEMI